MQPIQVLNTRINKALMAGFDEYTETKNAAGSWGVILTNTDTNSPYNGECIDLFEDGSFVQYCQFKGQTAAYTIN